MEKQNTVTITQMTFPKRSTVIQVVAKKMMTKAMILTTVTMAVT